MRRCKVFGHKWQLLSTADVGGTWWAYGECPRCGHKYQRLWSALWGNVEDNGNYFGDIR